MTLVEANEVADPERRSRTPWARVAFYLALIAWNTYFVGGMIYTLWMGHHPNVQTGRNNVVLSLELYSLVLGNLVILGVGFVVRRLARRRQSSTLA